MLPQDKLDAILARHDEITAHLAEVSDPALIVRLSKELSDITELSVKIRAYRAFEAEERDLLALLDDLLELGHLRHELGREGLVLGGFRLADLFRNGIPAALGILELGEVAAARLVQFDQLGRKRLEPTAFEPGIEGLGVVSDPLDVEHGNASGESRL